MAMPFCRAGPAYSLREVFGGLAACEGKHQHLGITAPSHSAFADAYEHRPWTLSTTVSFQLLGC